MRMRLYLAHAYLDRVRLLSLSWRHKKSQRMACIDSRVLSTTVASLCQTLCELLHRWFALFHWVCLSVNLTSRVFVRLTNNTTYLMGDECQKFRAVFSENAPLQS